MLEKLKQSVLECPVVERGDYHYFVHPITDGVPHMDPEVLQEAVDGIIRIGDFDCDLIVTPEAMGIHLAVPVALRLGIPYNIIRKRSYGLPGEVSVSQVTGYSRSDLYVNGIKAGDRVVVVDDVLSTGGTLRAIVEALMKIGAEVVDVITVFEKTAKKKEVEEELGLRIKSLLRVDVVDGKTIYYD